MNGLLWKEWRENRLIVAFAAMLTFVLLIGAIYFAVDRSGLPPHTVSPSDLSECLLFIWCLSALLCSCTMVAPEIGSGSLQFLSSLPISRKRIWLTKLLVCLVILVLSMAASTLIFIGVYAVASHAGVISGPVKYTMPPIADLWMLPMTLVALPLCALGMLVTMLVDRTITALMVSIIASIAGYALFVGISNLPAMAWADSGSTALVLWIVCVLVLFSVSYQTFLRGETLRTSARFKIAIPSFLQSLAVIAVAIGVAYLWILL